MPSLIKDDSIQPNHGLYEFILEISNLLRNFAHLHSPSATASHSLNPKAIQFVCAENNEEGLSLRFDIRTKAQGRGDAEPLTLRLVVEEIY